MWLLLAFSAPLLWAISTHIDKYLVDRFFKESSVGVLLIFTALIGIVPLPLIAEFQPGVFAIPRTAMAVIAFAGVLYMGAMYFYLGALQEEEASVVSPLFQASPLFAYGLAYFLLGERLTELQMLGGLLIVASALMLATRPGASGRHRFRPRLIVLMLACAFSLALSSVMFKIFALRDEFWTTTFWMFAGEVAFGAVLFAIPQFRTQFSALFRSNPGAVIAINAANELINLGGGLFARFAFMLGSLSLTQAISSTSPLFVFLIGVALSLFFPSLGREDLSPRNLVQKGAAIAFVIAGVILITR